MQCFVENQIVHRRQVPRSMNVYRTCYEYITYTSSTIRGMDYKTVHNTGLECFVGFKYTDNFVEENANKPQRQVWLRCRFPIQHQSYLCGRCNVAFLNRFGFVVLLETFGLWVIRNTMCDGILCNSFTINIVSVCVKWFLGIRFDMVYLNRFCIGFVWTYIEFVLSS